jgi:hypothetical protein
MTTEAPTKIPESECVRVLDGLDTETVEITVVQIGASCEGVVERATREYQCNCGEHCRNLPTSQNTWRSEEVPKGARRRIDGRWGGERE